MQPTIRQIIYDKHPINQKVRFLYRFFKWQFIDKVLKQNLVFRFTPNSKLMLLNGFHALSGNYYFGLAEPDVMPFFLHALREDDLFVDIGANGGTYTILASGEKRAKTVAIEASPEVFEGLTKNIQLNKLEGLVDAWNVAVSDVNGQLRFTKSDHATNHVLLEDRDDSITVEARTLDTILNGRIPNFIKMDIEGHEHNALLGGHQSISNEGCKAMVIEFANTGIYYGYGNNATHELITGYGFKPYRYDIKTRELTSFNPLAETEYFNINMIYIRDLEFVKQRLATANEIMMSGQLV